MRARLPFAVAAIASLLVAQTHAQASERVLTLAGALSRALATNPRLTAAERDIGIATGRRIQAGAIPNPELSAELDDSLGSGKYRGTRSAETTLQISQVVELWGKRDARIAAGMAEVDAVTWQRRATRLEILSETAIAFFSVLGLQRRVEILTEQVASLNRLTPLLQRRIDAGAASPAETGRSTIAADLVRVDLERTRGMLASARRELAILMGDNAPSFASVTGRSVAIGSAPPFAKILAAIESNPALMRWTSVRAQRNAELLIARLKPYPDLRLSAGWRHYNETGDDAVRLGVSVALPIWDQNKGDILAAQQNLEKTRAERAINRAALLLVAGRAYDTLTSSLRELQILRDSTIPTARTSAAAIEAGFEQGRFTLLEVLDVLGSVGQANLREQEATQNLHTAIATLEGLVGDPFVLARGANR
ncbi:divalent cation transporter [Bradyrhizobium lablabi]|uniref:Divalent cation transporter n=1 Tax=Bradyrhizobium lablabi TaxID=722472 RepID=A0A0R3MNQ9_9BRAD|nr:TolC family protein [Bradyrhizobium lablabi]KRR18566.1 divalent cation transporter [Bradyrhizobium lablabi]